VHRGQCPGLFHSEQTPYHDLPYQRPFPWWCPTWPITWQRAYATARQRWLEADGRVGWAQLPTDTVFEGEQLGRWVKAQRAGWPDLEADQQDLLSAIGIEEDQELVAAKAATEAKPKVHSAAASWASAR
jgi:hypothetical protein